MKQPNELIRRALGPVADTHRPIPHGNRHERRRAAVLAKRQPVRPAASQKR